MTFDLSAISIILQSILVAVVIVLAVFAWRWLRVALDRGQLQAQNEALAQLTVYAKIFVNAAEQTLYNSPGFARLDWVLDQFATVMPDVDRDLIRSVVEATVRSLPATTPPKPLALVMPTATTTVSTGTPSTPPPTIIPPAACESLAPQPLEYSQAPATSHSHKDRGKPKAAQTV